MGDLLSLRQLNLINTATSWNNLNPVLLLNEIAFESDTGLYKIGDGHTPWRALSYGKNSNKIIAGRGIRIHTNEISTQLLYYEIEDNFNL